MLLTGNNSNIFGALRTQLKLIIVGLDRLLVHIQFSGVALVTNHTTRIWEIQ